MVEDVIVKKETQHGSSCCDTENSGKSIQGLDKSLICIRPSSQVIVKLVAVDVNPVEKRKEIFHNL